MNPGGSVKDRAALYLIKDAEEKGFDRLINISIMLIIPCEINWARNYVNLTERHDVII